MRTEAGQRYPLTLSMLLFDSSGGVNKEASRKEHLEALRTVVGAATTAGADPMAVTCALDWLLYDWLMAHRDGPDSAEIVFPPRATSRMRSSSSRRRRPPPRPGRHSIPGCSASRLR